MKKSTAKDWHPADIIAALHKRDTGLVRLSREARLASSTLTNALKHPWSKGGWLIANTLEIHPSKIWPGRYLHAVKKHGPGKPLHSIAITDHSGYNDSRCGWQDTLINDT